MAEKNIMTPSTASLSGLLGNGITYRVPTFQRDYSWQEENWEDLWNDILIVLESDRDHYMGSIVLQKKGDKNFLVIDGQQRFTTLSLLALAVIRNIHDLIDKDIEAKKNTERIEELRRGFLGYKDPSSLSYSSKLFLNETNNAFYQGHLLQLRSPANERMLPDSDKLMWHAYKFFYEKVKKYFEKKSTGEALANFLNKIIGDKMQFIQIQVEDEVSAYTLFETLNYRGLELTVTDLLKNYLFSLLGDADLGVAKELWKSIVLAVGLEKFPIFLRHYWISKNTLITAQQLFKVIRNSITDTTGVFSLLEDLEKSADDYVSLTDPLHDNWRSDRNKFKRIRELSLFGVKQCLPVLLAAKKHFSDTEFSAMLKLVSVISFRYNIIGSKHTSILEVSYNAAAVKISNKVFTRTAEVFKETKALYPDDKDFINDFSTAEFPTKNRTKKIARYILFELENQLTPSDRDFETDPATIEHILPENPPDSWDDSFQPQKQEKYIYRLGNYCLLEDTLNKKCADKNFPFKKEQYAQSQYTLAKKVTMPEWSPLVLEQRQKEMAKWATACWKAPYADTSS